MPAVFDSDIVSRIRDEYEEPLSSGQNPRSEHMRDENAEDPAPARLNDSENDGENDTLTGKVFTAKDRKDVAKFLNSVYPLVAGAISMKCAQCGELIGGCQDAWCDAAAGVIIRSYPALAMKIIGGDGPVNMDLIMLCLLTMQMATTIAHHHIPVLRDRVPDPMAGFDPLQPEVPWQQ
jgi:hypothetical protein